MEDALAEWDAASPDELAAVRDAPVVVRDAPAAERDAVAAAAWYLSSCANSAPLAAVRAVDGSIVGR